MRMEERRANLQRKREARLQMGDNHEAVRFFNENFDKGKEGMPLKVCDLLKINLERVLTENQSSCFESACVLCRR